MALIGTDSLKGKEIKRVLKKNISPIQSLEFFDPEVKEEYSKLTEFKGEPRVILPLNEEALNHLDLVFLAADKKINKKYGVLVSNKRFKAIDLSETFNMNTQIPVIVAGINDHIIKK